MQEFSSHPQSHTILDIIKSALSSRPSHSNAPAITPDLIPLIPVTQSSDSLPPRSPSYSLLNVTSTASSQVVNRFSESIIAKTRQAGDHFVVGRQSDISYYIRGHNMRQFLPKQPLSFFHVITLANVVHDQNPLYSIFTKQCYWFANIIYYVLEDFSNKSDTADSIANEPDEYLGIRIPPNVYLPDEAGRWFGIMITRVSEEVVRLMVNMFVKKQEEILLEVCLFSLVLPTKSNFLHRLGTGGGNCTKLRIWLQIFKRRSLHIKLGLPCWKAALVRNRTELLLRRAIPFCDLGDNHLNVHIMYLVSSHGL
jgi:hypothetical protein